MTDKITNKITKIVLTGGPCAGKTTAMAQIIEHFSSLGFQVFAIPEVPTMFSSAGINYLTDVQQRRHQLPDTEQGPVL